MESWQEGLRLQGEAAIVRVKSMEIANKQREIEGKPPEYDEDAFLREAGTLESIARDIQMC